VPQTVVVEEAFVWGCVALRVPALFDTTTLLGSVGVVEVCGLLPLLVFFLSSA
jgi:hypothetical protein